MKSTKRILQLVIISSLISLPVRAEEILDVEMGMEDAFQESEGARLEAEASQRRQEQREKEKLAAEESALNAIAKAKAKERDAKQEIAATDKAIQKLNKEIKIAEEKRLKAEDQYELYSKKVADKRAELETTQGLLNSKKAELSEKQNQVNALVSEARDTDQQILKIKDEISFTNRELKRVNDEKLQASKRLGKAKSKLKSSKQRTPASRTSRILSLGLKKDCKAYASPSLSDSAVWTGQKGQRVSASSYDATWANLVLSSGAKAFIAKSCF